MILLKCSRFVDFTPGNYDLDGWDLKFKAGYPDEFSLFNGKKILGGKDICNSKDCVISKFYHGFDPATIHTTIRVDLFSDSVATTGNYT